MSDAVERNEHWLVQVLTDPENQPNQYGFDCHMKGRKMAFKIGNQAFTLDYEPDDDEEFAFMRKMLASAFSIFTPGVKTDRIERLEDVLRKAYDAMLSCTSEDTTTGNVIYAYHDQDAIDSAIEAVDAALKDQP